MFPMKDEKIHMKKLHLIHNRGSSPEIFHISHIENCHYFYLDEIFLLCLY